MTPSKRSTCTMEPMPICSWRTEDRRDSSKLSVILSNKILLSSQNCNTTSDRTRSLQKTLSQVSACTPVDHDYCCLGCSCNVTILDCDNATPQYYKSSFDDTPSIDVSLHLDDSAIWYSTLETREEMTILKNVGLTQINLERLADFGNVCDSICSPSSKHSIQEIRSNRVRERRETFLRVMQESNKQKCRNTTENQEQQAMNQLLEKWDRLDVGEICTLLDDITEILYVKNMSKSSLKPKFFPRKPRRKLFDLLTQGTNKQQEQTIQLLTTSATHNIATYIKQISRATLQHERDGGEIGKPMKTLRSRTISLDKIKNTECKHQQDQRSRNSHVSYGKVYTSEKISSWDCITHSEKWIKNPLDQESMLQLI